jgi:hypothetical protein
MAVVSITRPDDDEHWTIERLIDELYLCLATCPTHNYQKQAYDLMSQIPHYKPIPVFVIKIPHLSQQVKWELDDRWKYKRELNYILKEAVGRIFANVDERYFLLSVKRLLIVELKN